MLSRKLENGTPYWSVAPQPLYGGTTATILYNSKAGPLNWLDGPPPKADKATIVSAGGRGRGRGCGSSQGGGCWGCRVA